MKRVLDTTSPPHFDYGIKLNFSQFRQHESTLSVNFILHIILSMVQSYTRVVHNRSTDLQIAGVVRGCGHFVNNCMYCSRIIRPCGVIFISFNPLSIEPNFVGFQYVGYIECGCNITTTATVERESLSRIYTVRYTN